MTIVNRRWIRPVRTFFWLTQLTMTLDVVVVRFQLMPTNTILDYDYDCEFYLNSKKSNFAKNKKNRLKQLKDHWITRL